MKNSIYLFATLLLLAFMPPKEKIKVYLIGDSTICEYPLSRAPLTGWGMPFKTFFDSTVIVDNRARGGRSTRTFISENRWQPIADSLKAGDYVLIQFGHNDEAKEARYKDRYTPVPDYKTNLIRFITESRAKKAVICCSNSVRFIQKCCLCNWIRWNTPIIRAVCATTRILTNLAPAEWLNWYWRKSGPCTWNWRTGSSARRKKNKRTNTA